MNIILLQDIDKVGGKYEVVSVKDGYGRNYLIPQKMAIIANETNLKRLDDLKRRENAQAAKMVAAAQEIANQLEGKVLKIGAKAGTSGKIFGSITNLQLAQALQEQFSIEIDRRKIDFGDEDIKELGTYTAKLNIHSEVDTRISFEVVEE